MTIDDIISGTPYVSYAYSYPHKTAYRPLESPVTLAGAWSDERKEALFLYLHVPFCEMRCGFCNLFTTAHPSESLEMQYLNALRRQAEVVREATGPVTIARMAVGGGTPTYLDLAGLDTLFDIAEGLYGADLAAIPISVETSPRTAEPEKLALLRRRGVDRVSIGVQSFVEAEVAAIGRAQKTGLVETALSTIREAGIPSLNIDLMYGLPGQTVETWLESLRSALRFAPEELYLYPLYVRPLTGLDRSPKSWDDIRLACYRAARDLLRTEGYEQVSMRMFRKTALRSKEGPVYCCQEDGMIGLGCGARSYTETLHYSSEYAVGRSGVKSILADYVSKSSDDFAVADYGVLLDREEQRRRHIVKSLLQTEGLAPDDYRRRFGSSPQGDLPELGLLQGHGLAELRDGRLVLTETGLERSDAIGPWLYSAKMARLIGEYELQ